MTQHKIQSFEKRKCRSLSSSFFHLVVTQSYQRTSAGTRRLELRKLFSERQRSSVCNNQDLSFPFANNNLHALLGQVKSWDKGDAPPVFLLDGVNYLYIRKNGLLIACTTRFNMSPSVGIELLNRTAKVTTEKLLLLSPLVRTDGCRYLRVLFCEVQEVFPTRIPRCRGCWVPPLYGNTCYFSAWPHPID